MFVSKTTFSLKTSRYLGLKLRKSYEYGLKSFVKMAPGVDLINIMREAFVPVRLNIRTGIWHSITYSA
jgi:hypothetical protein